MHKIPKNIDQNPSDTARQGSTFFDATRGTPSYVALPTGTVLSYKKSEVILDLLYRIRVFSPSITNLNVKGKFPD